MLTKENVETILKFYRTIPDEIKLYREKRAELEDSYNPLQSPCIDGMPHVLGTSDQTANKALKLVGYEAEQIREIDAYIISLEQLANAIFSTLKVLPYYEKMVVYRFYLDDWSWTKITFELRYSEAQCRRFRNRALSKLAKMFISNQVIISFKYPER